MKPKPLVAMLGFAIAGSVGVVQAAELAGEVQDIDPDDGTVTVEGIEFFITEETDFDMALQSYRDLEVGQLVEISFDVVDDLHVISQIRPQPFQP